MGSASVIRRATTWGAAMGPHLRPLGLIGMSAGCVALPQVFHSDYALRILDMILIWSLLAIGQNVITGFCGQLSIGHAAFYGLGAYTSALLTIRMDVPFPLALLMAGATATLLGIAVGFPAIRVGGDYFFIVTIGMSAIVQLVFLNFTELTNGPMGIPAIPPAQIFTITLVANSDYYYLLLGLVAIVSWMTWQIMRSDIGRAFRAIREDETAARAMGVNVTYYKVLAFSIGAFYAGMAGSVLAHFLGFVGPQGFTPDESLLVFEMVILGGLGSIAGSIIGAALLVGSTELIRGLIDYRLYIGGFLLIVLMRWRPQGLIGTVRLRAPQVRIDPTASSVEDASDTTRLHATDTRQLHPKVPPV
jgi:branched-chain amino acid transport system permease protein